MAIAIQQLSPTNPSTQAGNNVLFSVSATESQGLTISYEWQYSTDGVNYSSAGLSNNTSNTYDTGALTVNQSGIYYRCVLSTSQETVNSNEYAGIGDRVVVVFQDPSIITFVDSTLDFLPTSQIKTVGDTLSLTVSATLSNADVTTTTLTQNIQFTWQISEDAGQNWTDIVPISGQITVTNTNALITGTTNSYMRYSTLLIQNLSFDDNLDQYRVKVEYTGAINTPVTTPVSQLLIDPVINIIREPGIAPTDTQTTDCYKTSIANSGELRVSVSALTTAGTALGFNWQVNYDGGATEQWDDVDASLGAFMFILKPGTTADTDVLELERMIYFDQVGFRCVITGTNGEATVTSDAHYIYMTDVEGTVDVDSTTIDVVEDRYGDVVDRDTYINDPVQYASLGAEIDIQRNTGQNGNNTFTWQRQDPGTSTWTDITDPAPVVVDTENVAIQYTQFPSTLGVEIATLTLETVPLRVATDDGAKYRVKVESSSRFTLSGNTKTLIPYYSSEITVNVYPTVYITNQPGDSTAYPNYGTAFSVTATPSSGLSSSISYQWQYNTANVATGWSNISNTSPYSGATTNLLTIDPIPTGLTYTYFRCVMSVPNQLSSITSDTGQLTLLRDYFTSLSSINDVVVREFDNHTFSVSASSVSAGPIAFQWQKSTNYNPSNNTGTWSDISGATGSGSVSDYTILNVTSAAQAYYRVKCTSSGGEILYSNAALLTFQEVKISILQNTPTTSSILEGESAALTLSTEGLSSIGTEVSYQWEIKRSGDASFSPIGSGHLNSVDTNKDYVLRAQDTDTDSGAKIRCKMTATDVPGQVYTNETTVTVIRRFTYFADEATKTVTIGTNLTIDLNPSFTGGTPAYSWVEGSTAVSGQTGSVLVIPNIDASYNGKVYKCEITLTNCTQHRYSRNNSTITNTVSGPTYTVTVTIATTTAPSIPTYYSNESAKTGAAMGTVICVPKPPTYVEDASATVDDAGRWGIAKSGASHKDGNITSNRVQGPEYNANKPSWVNNSAYRAQKWLLSTDRFPGYLELRGQYLRARQFPELARQYGTKFDGNITGSYPNYDEFDYFRMPMTYAKRLVGTGNVNNNSGSTSVVPTYGADGLSGGDKNVPGSMGGVYNYVRSAQLPPGSPGVTGKDDGTADGSQNAATFSIGSYTTAGMDEVSAFVQPTFAGSVSYSVTNPNEAFTDLPVHTHSAVSAGWLQTQALKTSGCQGKYGKLNASGPFHVTEPTGGILANSTTTEGKGHAHTIKDIGPGSFNMVTDAGMGITDTTLRFTGANGSIMNNNIEFFLRNNEPVPMNAPYFRLKYLIKAY